VKHSLTVIGKLALLPFVIGMTAWTFGQSSRLSLEEGFETTPPNSPKPRVWWHWMNGNITKEGIKLDFGMDEPCRHRRLSEF